VISSSELGGAQGLRVGVIIPAYNEAGHISAVIESVPAFVDRILVVDDCSSDTTADAVCALTDPRVRFIQRAENGGVGAAMATGYRAALEESLDIAVKIDADGQMEMTELERLVMPIVLGLADYTKGNRFFLERGTQGMPAERMFGSVALSFMTKMASGYWHVYDSQCGFTALRTTFLRMVDIDRIAPDYFFENDMLIKLNALNARVVDVPTKTLYGDETSHVNVSRVLLTFPPRFVAGGFRRAIRKYFVTDFGAAGAFSLFGLLLVLFGAAFGGYHWWISAASGVSATTGQVMIAVLPLIVGIQLLIQAVGMEVANSPGAEETAEYVHYLIQNRSLK
jgi:dolichol-phosphate mannosyltransferase